MSNRMQSENVLGWTHMIPGVKHMSQQPMCISQGSKQYRQFRIHAPYLHLIFYSSPYWTIFPMSISRTSLPGFTSNWMELP